MNINFVELQNKIIENPDLIVVVLEKLGYKNIKDRGSHFTCGNSDGDNISAMCIYKDTLRYQNYTRNHGGNIISLVMNTANVEFPKALEMLSKWCGFTGLSNPIKLPFHSFYKSIISESTDEIPILPTYDEKCLPNPNNYSLKWIKEGVDIQTQSKFGVRYDLDTNGIIIPEYDMYGSIVGAKWRNADPNCEMSERWNMYIRFNQSHNLYGLNINYPTIAKKSKVIITEAEKSTQHLYSWGCGLGVSVNGHHISKVQQNILKSLMCDEIIVAFDKDVCEEEIKYKSEQLKVNNLICKNKISYIYDREGLLGEKDSPTDKGQKIFTELFKRRIFI